jgi:hypothetical protein
MNDKIPITKADLERLERATYDPSEKQKGFFDDESPRRLYGIPKE